LSISGFCQAGFVKQSNGVTYSYMRTHSDGSTHQAESKTRDDSALIHRYHSLVDATQAGVFPQLTWNLQ